MRRFLTLAAAGRELAGSLTEFHDASNTIVLAIVSGGVQVAAEVASQLSLPFDLLFIRRLLAPSGAQNVICAFNVGGTLVLDEGIAPALSDSPAGQKYAIAEALDQLKSRVRAGRGNQPPLEFTGKNIILVDNGIHTGSTMLGAIRAVRKLEVGRIVVAVPVANPSSRAAIECSADDVICLEWPEKFGHVGLWYKEFVGRGDDKWVNGRARLSTQKT